MVLSGPRHIFPDGTYVPPFAEKNSHLDVNKSEDFHIQWFSSSNIDDTANSFACGEEGLTQSPTSEDDELNDPLETHSQDSGFSLDQVSTEGQGVFAEVYEFLRNTPLELHPFLDMDEQRLVVDNERLQRHYELFLALGQKNTSPPNELGIFSKSLLSEAHRVHISSIRRYNKTCQEKSLPMKNEQEINKQWRHIKSAVEQDLYMEGHAVVQRRLSCMCIFNPDTDERPYGDNEKIREQRLMRQESVLSRLKEQSKNGGSPFFVSNVPQR